MIEYVKKENVIKESEKIKEEGLRRRTIDIWRPKLTGKQKCRKNIPQARCSRDETVITEPTVTPGNLNSEIIIYKDI